MFRGRHQQILIESEPLSSAYPFMTFTRVVSYRSGVVENTHTVQAAVLDSGGNVLLTIGDPGRLTLIRSAAKPAQALAILETGCFERYLFDDVDLALMCASHSSEPLHTERTLRMLSKIQIGAGEADFKCGGHPPLSSEVREEWIRMRYSPSGLNNNCSGKHVGMMAAALAMGHTTRDYHLDTHPVQQHVRKVTEELTGPITWAVDGCNLPTPAMPISTLAKMYATFSTPIDNLRGALMDRIYTAMHTYPELIAGKGRFDTRLMELTGDRLIGKIGADAVFGIGVKESDATRKMGAVGGVGIGIKVEDGNEEAMYVAIVEILSELGVLGEDEAMAFEDYRRPKRLNSMGVCIGHLTAE